MLNYRLIITHNNTPTTLAEFHAIDKEHASIIARAIVKSSVARYNTLGPDYEGITKDSFTLHHLIIEPAKQEF